MLDQEPTPEDNPVTVLPPDWTFAPIVAKLREWNLTYEIVSDFPLSRVRTDEHSQVRQLAAHRAGLRVEEYSSRCATALCSRRSC